MENVIYELNKVCKDFEGYGNPKEQSQYAMLEEFLKAVQKAFYQDLFTEQWCFINDERDGSTQILNCDSKPIYTAHFDTDGTIHSIELHEDQVPNTVHALKCPLCLEGDMLYEPIPNPQAMGETLKGMKVTHIYTCDTCPCVTFEFYTKPDSECIAKSF